MPKSLLKQYDCIHIITDNKNTHNWIAQTQTINENYMYQLFLIVQIIEKFLKSTQKINMVHIIGMHNIFSDF